MFKQSGKSPRFTVKSRIYFSFACSCTDCSLNTAFASLCISRSSYRQCWTAVPLFSPLSLQPKPLLALFFFVCFKNFKCFYFFYDFISFLWLYYCKVYLGDIFVYYTITTLCYSRWHGLCDILPLIRQTSVKAYFFLFYSNKLRNMRTWVCCKIWPERRCRSESSVC